jgi:hypothetical protein
MRELPLSLPLVLYEAFMGINYGLRMLCGEPDLL